jgi:hypothetical protein
MAKFHSNIHSTTLSILKIFNILRKTTSTTTPATRVCSRPPCYRLECHRLANLACSHHCTLACRLLHYLHYLVLSQCRP